MKLTGPHGQLLEGFLLGRGVFGQDERSVRVGQGRAQACVVLQDLTGRRLLAEVVENRPVRRQYGVRGAEEGGGQCAHHHPDHCNNGAAARGGHLGGFGPATLHPEKKRTFILLFCYSSAEGPVRDGVFFGLQM